MTRDQVRIEAGRMTDRKTDEYMGERYEGGKREKERNQKQRDEND